jgi:hypothetical protein
MNQFPWFRCSDRKIHSGESPERASRTHIHARVPDKGCISNYFVIVCWFLGTLYSLKIP